MKNKIVINNVKNLQDLKEINVYVIKEEEDKYLLKEIKKIVLL